MPIELGTVGWVDDAGTPQDLGDSTNDGANLVRVTLYAGRGPVTPLDQTQAQGKPLLCTLADNVAIPARGTTVVVAIPDSHSHVPGAPVVIATLSSDWKANANAKAAGGTRVLSVPGSQARIYLKPDGTIVLRTTLDNTADGDAMYLVLGPAVGGFQLQTPFGTFILDQYGMRLRSASGAMLKLGGISMPSPLNALSSTAKLSAAFVKVDGTQVMLGPDIPGQSWQPAAMGFPTDTPPQPFLSGLESTSVKISP